MIDNDMMMGKMRRKMIIEHITMCTSFVMINYLLFCIDLYFILSIITVCKNEYNIL